MDKTKTMSKNESRWLLGQRHSHMLFRGTPSCIQNESWTASVVGENQESENEDTVKPLKKTKEHLVIRLGPSTHKELDLKSSDVGCHANCKDVW